MHWSLSPSPEPPHAGEPERLLMRRRFVEALRRAEIISLVNAARSVEELTPKLTEELCEVYEAELGFVVDGGRRGDPWRALALVGGVELDVEGLQRWGAVLESLASGRATSAHGEDLLGAGGRSALVATHVTADERRVVLGVVRLYDSTFDPAELALLEAVTSGAGHALDRLWSHAERAQLVAQLRAQMVGTAAALANALEARDDYTAGHAQDIAELSVTLGSRLGLAGEALEELRFGAIFHDIGKIAVPDEILRKPEPLSAAERAVIERHTLVGAEILEPVPLIGEVPRLVLHSHERFDGGGYPHRLRGEEIPLGSRIIAVVDAWHAMVSDRPYQGELPRGRARQELVDNAGTQFDPAVVSAFVGMIDAGEI